MRKRVTPKQIAANRANAKKPRPLRGQKPSAQAVARAENFKETIGGPALKQCLEFWVGVLNCTVKREIVSEDGSVFPADPSLEQRLAASREIANRCGLPALTQVDAGKAAFPIVVVGADWPGIGQ